MSTTTTSSNCPKTLPVPFTVTVNTSGSIPSAVTNVHSLSDTHAGFTRISKFTLTPLISAGDPSIEDHFPHGISNSIAKWDFGDGYTLSGTDTFIAEHIYNVPGIYTVAVFLYDKDSNAYKTTFTETLSIYNYSNTHLSVDTPNITVEDGLAARIATAGQKKTFNLSVTASWQDIPDPTDKQTIFFTSSGSQAKPYDFNNKYAHLVPYNAFYDDENNIINNIDGLNISLTPQYFYINTDNTIQRSLEKDITTNKAILLYSSTDKIDTFSDTIFTIPYPVKFSYVDDIPTDQVNLLMRLNTSRHRIKSFYVDDITVDINNSKMNFLETDIARPIVKDKSTVNVQMGDKLGVPVKVITPFTSRLSFTSTGMKEMSSIQYKRQGDKFQVFVALSDDELNIGKYYNTFYVIAGAVNPAVDRQFAYEWSDGTTTTTSNISSLCTEYFPYDNVHTALSSFAYLNINPVSAGTWSLNITGRLDSFTVNPASAAQGNTLDYDPDGPLGPVSIGVAGNNLITGSYTFTVFPSTNDAEIYKINEDVDYSQVLKSYRFQSLLHDYDKLFDGVFTSFVGEASSSPTTFGKTVFEKIANFTINNSDVDFCKIENLETFYEFFNEDIDLSLPDPPPELKRLYNLFSVKITKLLGDYDRFDKNFDTQFYTSSAASRNIDFESKIDATTYAVSADVPFVARQKFNDEYTLIKPQKIASISFQPSNELWDLTTTNLNFATTTGWEATVSDQINDTGNTPLSGWVLTGTDAGHTPYTGTPSVNPLHQDINAKPGADYKITVTVASSTAGTLKVIVGQDSNAATLPETAGVTDNGTHTVTITNEPLGAIDSLLRFEASQDWDGNIDNIIIQEVISVQYPLSAYNEYSNWGWPLDTTVSGASGLDLFYEFYPYTTYDTTASAENIQNNLIDYNNPYNTITRAQSSLSASWDPDGGIVFKNLDYQIRKGLQL